MHQPCAGFENKRAKASIGELKANDTLVSSLDAFSLSSFLCCEARAAVLSITRGSTTGCSRPGGGAYLLMPTMTSSPESMRA